MRARATPSRAHSGNTVGYDRLPSRGRRASPRVGREPCRAAKRSARGGLRFVRGSRPVSGGRRPDQPGSTGVVANLLDNALQYRDPARQGEIDISARQDERQVVYCVRDNGIGIAAEPHERFSSRFVVLRLRMCLEKGSVWLLLEVSFDGTMRGCCSNRSRGTGSQYSHRSRPRKREGRRKKEEGRGKRS
jgi:hypothetical protein